MRWRKTYFYIGFAEQDISEPIPTTNNKYWHMETAGTQL
jgi:hypothetical protein